MCALAFGENAPTPRIRLAWAGLLAIVSAPE